MKIVEIRESPISLQMAYLHLRLGDDISNNLLVEDKLQIAVSIAEGKTSRIIQECVIELDASFTAINDKINLPIPTSEISEISYFDTKKNIIPLKGNFIHYSTTVQDVLLLINDEYIGKLLTIKLVCGYSVRTIPAAIRGAILLILGSLYENESSDIMGRSTSQISITADNILDKYRIIPY